MKDEQKRFTIEKIQKCQTEVNKIEKKIDNRFLFILGGVAVTISAMMAAPEFADSRASFMGVNYCGLLGGATAVAGLRSMISNICKKANLETMTDYLKYQLDSDELGEKEEHKGRGL